MAKASSALIPPGHVWMAAIPILPLIIGTLVLGSLIEPGKRLAFLTIGSWDYLEKPVREFVHLGDMLVYVSFASIHVIACIGVIIYLVILMRRLPSRACRRSVAFSGVVALAIIALVLYFDWKSNELIIVQLGYKAICMAIETANLSTELASGCFDGDSTKLTWFAWVPTFSGMGAVAFAAGFAYGNADALPEYEDAEWQTVFNGRVNGLQKGLYALSMILVSSTIVITIFAHLPAGLFNDGNGLATAVSKYAIGLSTFWGAIFSLTLAATFAAPAYLLLRQTRGYQSVVGDAADLRAWLHEHVFVSIKKQLVNVASLLAPLLVGPLSSLFASFAGA